MKDNTILLIVGMICLTVGYLSAAMQGINGLLFTGFTNAILAIVLGSYAISRRKSNVQPTE